MPSATRTARSSHGRAGPALGDLASIVKAYDIRGVVPDQLDEGVAEAVGAAFVAGDRRRDDRDHARHAHLLGPAGGGVRPRRDRPGRRRDRRRPGLDRHALLRQRRPRYARRDVHRQPQPGPVQRHQAVPGRAPGRSAARPAWPRSGTWPNGPRTAAPVRRHRSPERDLLAGYAEHLRKLVDLSAIRPLTVVVDAGNGMARPHRARRSSTGCRSTLIPLYFELDGTFPNHEANPHRARRTCATCRRRCPSTAPTSGWPSTATPTGASWSTSAASRSRPSVITALIAARELAREPGATIIHNLITSRAVPEIVTRARRRPGAHPGRPLVHQGRDGRAPARCSAASTRGTSTSATSGSPTRACSPRCTCWPRWASSDAAAVAAARQVLQRYVASGEINSEVADQAAVDRAGQAGVRRPARGQHRRARRAHRQHRRTGGSTSGRPTPSRCCGSTSRRDDRGRPWRRCATRCSAWSGVNTAAS